MHDTILGLYWEQSPSTTERTWSNSKTHCSNLGSGWRLPTLVELEASLVDVGRASDPYIVGGSGGSNLFDNVQSSVYWADTRYGSSPAYAVRFDRGSSYARGVTSIYYALCVKEDSNYDVIWNTTQKYPYEGGLGQERVGGEFIEDASECGGSGTMYDTITNLCWEKSPSTSSYEHSNAQSHCSGVATAGGGWRLPEKAELMTLLYHDGTGSTETRLNSIGFSGIQNDYYWSNTLDAFSSSFVYAVGFYHGYSSAGYVTHSLSALCVKTAP